MSFSSSNETDRKALLDFRNLITSPSQFFAINWTKNTSFCSWFGVTCSTRRQRVVVQGTISPSLANLSFLSVLNLGNNSLHGDVPYVLGHLPPLRVIDIRNNQLQGSIPTSLFQHQRVQKISLAFNKLGSEVCKGPWKVPKLSVLNLRNNSLTSIIPPPVGNAAKLMNFSLSGNRINGNIPKEIGNMSQLASLVLHDNQLTGSIPTSLFNISSLVVMSLALNSLSGSLLLDEGNIVSNLKDYSHINGQYFHSSKSFLWQQSVSGANSSGIREAIKFEAVIFCPDDNLIGQIPEAIFNISFNLNNLSGRIPSTTGLHLPNLKEVNWGVNQLEGEIPLFITNASKLEIPMLNNNFLTGTVPTNLGNLCELQSLFLHTNQLTNEPREHEARFFNSLTDCRTLRYVEMDDNPLNGVLPNYIGNLSSTIENFYISNALINGLIPTGIGNMSSLTELNFEGNNLAGSIPSEIGKRKQLQGLFLTYNKLQGHITEAVCHLSNLVKLTLAGNNLTGEIPECIGNLSMLQLLSLLSNRLSSEVPLSIWKMSDLLYLDVSQNCIEGEFPSDIGELKAIIKLDFSSNHFLGMLPSKLGELQNLQYLDLSNNSFFGQIPLSFANLISLEFLHLSLNSLSEGEIPSGGVFVNSTLQSFLGNKGLFGVHILEVPACANPGLQSKSKELVLKVVIPVVISSFLIFLLASIWIVKRQKKGKYKYVEKVPDIRTHQLVSYHKIQRATNYFDESNLIDVGSSGSVYKGTLSSGIVVAIKILDLEYEEVCKRFDGECEVMRNVRHRNLVPVITTCSSDYIRAFVLQYMSNGSLENWLYREDCNLNLLQRVTVMLDSAMGIEYLDHGHITPIVNCDLKPANILLDDDMVAHVGDFGISKILAVSKSMAYTETLGTLGYITPEYGSEGIVSPSGDVYSYGIMLMEVVTKIRQADEEICNENLDLRKWITQSFLVTMMDVVDVNL
ncbi:hypothetical protein BC332_12462 [Capsicum chinense]|nr:hypothetical protein BC332_12462 [Capsicum chinense]